MITTSRSDIFGKAQSRATEPYGITSDVIYKPPKDLDADRLARLMIERTIFDFSEKNLDAVKPVSWTIHLSPFERVLGGIEKGTDAID
mmetsp:Transcript_33931/g.71395  ORF Transcript_33931/g.71395 Transcript_33931/m.71395 type:complete len:88 (-) Transcript_33931:2166-2429(-)